MDKIRAIKYQSHFTREVISGEPGTESVGYLLRSWKDRAYSARELIQYAMANVTEFGVVRLKDPDTGNWYSATYKAGKIIGSTGEWADILLRQVVTCSASGGFGAVDYIGTVQPSNGI